MGSSDVTHHVNQGAKCGDLKNIRPSYLEDHVTRLIQLHTQQWAVASTTFHSTVTTHLPHKMASELPYTESRLSHPMNTTLGDIHRNRAISEAERLKTVEKFPVRLLRIVTFASKYNFFCYFINV